MNCPACGADVPGSARFCPECGQRLIASPDERRLVTVLMADLVGFTGLAETADPEHVKRLIDRCFERLVADITAFGGRLDKIVGDEIVAQFGAPVAHEDDAERAVRAALQMHETLASLDGDTGTPVRIRIGVNTGEVLVGALRAGGDPTVMGDVVNTASRLQGMAKPGQVVVGSTTFSATRASIRYEALGPITVKGRDEPVDAYVALEATAPPGRRRTRGRAPLVGRDAELELLHNIARVAATRRRAHYVVLFGDAGVGKSRLASEVSAFAGEYLGARVLSGQCVPYGDTNPYGPIAEALRRACGTDGLPTIAEARRKVAECVTSVLQLPPESPETERVVEGILYITEGIARPGVDPARARDDATGSVLAFFEGLATQTPLVFTLSDLQWADAHVIEFVERLLTRLRAHPLLLIATVRPSTGETRLPEVGRHNSVELHLDPLDPEATADLVRALFCDDVAPDVISFLEERSGGNPFFVEELVALVQESTAQDGELPRIGSDRLRELPATLHGLVAARLDALGASERSLLEDCAVVGGSGPVSAAIALSGISDPHDLLDELAARDLVVVDGEEFHFKSELIREIAYGRLTKAERARRHAALASFLEAQGDLAVDQVAHHLATAAELVAELGPVAGVPDDLRDRAVEALGRVASRAESVESWLTVARHYDRALALLGETPSPTRRNALIGRGRARAEHRDLDDARSDALFALDEARAENDAPREAASLQLLAEIQAHAGEYDGAEKTFGEALRCYRELDDSAGVAGALRGLGLVQLFRGESTEADRLISEALACYRSAGDRRGEAWGLQNLAWISFMRGHSKVAEARLHQSADLFAELGDWGGLTWALGLLAFVRYTQGRLDEAAELAERLTGEGFDTGNRWALGMMQVLLANVSLWRGHCEECMRRGREATALFHEIGDAWGESMALAPLARALAMRGRDAEYRELLEHLRRLSARLADPSMRQIAPSVEAAVELQRGDPAAALVALSAMSPTGEPGLADIDGTGTTGLAFLQSGRVDDAITVLAPLLSDADNDGAAAAVGGRIALAYAYADRSDDLADVIADLETRTGGTYSDRMFRLWAQGLALVRHGNKRGLDLIDEAERQAMATDCLVDQAIATLARAIALRTLSDPRGVQVRADAQERLDALGITGVGWERVFTSAAGLDGRV